MSRNNPDGYKPDPGLITTLLMNLRAVFSPADVWFECMPASQTVLGHNEGFQNTATVVGLKKMLVMC